MVLPDGRIGVSSENPFVGPTPFPRGKPEEIRFFGRQRETQELVSYILSQPLVLLYSPSGAGKSSLMNAGVIPALEQMHGFQVLPVARVRGRTDVERADRLSCFYTYQAILEMDPAVPHEHAESWTLADFLAQYPRPAQDDDPVARVVIFDQFEEILAIYSRQALEQQRKFFRQVAAALRADPLLRVVFLVREDRVSPLEPFATELLPYGLGLRYRLEHLGPDAALQAILETARGSIKEFSEEAAHILVHQLLKTRAEVRPGEFELIDGSRVEPVQLQVVCHSIWERANPGEIHASDLPRFGHIDDVLAGYYNDIVRSVAAQTGIYEGVLREWFSTRLVTAVRTRGTVFRGPSHTDEVIPIPNKVVDELEAGHIIRGERRAEGGGQWYELVHDTFIDPILQANNAWKVQRERRALAWTRIAIPPVVVVLCVTLGALLVNSSHKGSYTAGITGVEAITGNLARGEQSVRAIQVKQSGALALGVNTTGSIAELRLRRPDGRDQQVEDLDPSPHVRAMVADVQPGRYEVLIRADSTSGARYSLWFATGPELPGAPSSAPVSEQLRHLAAGPFLVRGTGAHIDLIAHSDAFDTILSVLPLDGSQKDTTNDDMESAQETCSPGSSEATDGNRLVWSDSKVGIDSKPGEIYLVYIQTINARELGSYSITEVPVEPPTPISLGVQQQRDIGPLGSVAFTLPNQVKQVSIQATDGGPLELIGRRGEQTDFTECISPRDLAGARLVVSPGDNRTILIRNTSLLRATFVVTTD